MSREVRRVPLDYKHPTVPNPNWKHHLIWRLKNGGRDYPPLHNVKEQFIPLMEYSWLATANKEAGETRYSYENRSGDKWDFQVEYHLTGFQSSRDTEPTVRPFYKEGDTWEDEGIVVKDEDHLQELLLKYNSDTKTREFSPDRYMPSFEDYDESELGYCLYESVSEGTPVTPVLATEEELIDHLVRYGTEANNPFRREAAENLVKTGFSAGSMFTVGNRLYDGAEDADKL